MDPGSQVRLPPQGGLPPARPLDGDVIEIACDESGFSGRNLLDTSIPVITHAGVDLTAEEAAELVGALREVLGHRVGELKSRQLLRGPRAAAAGELLRATLAGRSHVQVVDKQEYLAIRIVELFLDEPSYTAGTRFSQYDRPAVAALLRAGRNRSAGRNRGAGGDRGERWDAFLTGFVELVAVKRKRRPDRASFELFFRTRDELVAGLDDPAGELLRRLDPDRVWSVLERLTDGDRSIPPPLEPVLPALAETVLFWSAGHRRVLVIHDEQSALTAERLTRLQQMLADRAGPVSPLAGVLAVDSRDDPRVQLADLLAGTARRAAELPPADAGAACER